MLNRQTLYLRTDPSQSNIVLRASFKTIFFTCLIGLIAAQFNATQAIAQTANKSDILLHIVSQCLDPSKLNYCTDCVLPRVDSGCTEVTECKKTNEIWTLNLKYVAMRDIKMCGCPGELIHGLAIPRAVISGIEDPNRQEDIWQFAWNAGVERIEAESLALVVNPQSARSQNQLHIHLLRLSQNARNRFQQYEPIPVDHLENIWAVAESAAKSKKLKDYGVLVAKAQNAGYLVLVTPESPEAAFTVWKCN